MTLDHEYHEEEGGRVQERARPSAPLSLGEGSSSPQDVNKVQELQELLRTLGASSSSMEDRCGAAKGLSALLKRPDYHAVFLSIPRGVADLVRHTLQPGRPSSQALIEGGLRCLLIILFEENISEYGDQLSLIFEDNDLNLQGERERRLLRGQQAMVAAGGVPLVIDMIVSSTSTAALSVNSRMLAVRLLNALGPVSHGDLLRIGPSCLACPLIELLFASLVALPDMSERMTLDLAFLSLLEQLLGLSPSFSKVMQQAGAVSVLVRLLGQTLECWPDAMPALSVRIPCLEKSDPDCREIFKILVDELVKRTLGLLDIVLEDDSSPPRFGTAAIEAGVIPLLLRLLDPAQHLSPSESRMMQMAALCILIQLPPKELRRGWESAAEDVAVTKALLTKALTILEGLFTSPDLREDQRKAAAAIWGRLKKARVKARGAR